jgi:hypothetical protein
MKRINRARISIAVVLSAALIGCGGGSGNSSSSTSTASQSTLSADQKAFEQFALSPNASYNLIWSLPLSGMPVNGTNYLYESHASIAASPSTSGTQSLNGTSPTDIANSLSLPATFPVDRYLINGAIVVGSGLNNVSYQGTAIKVDALATDGVTVVDSELRSNLSIVPLSGAVAAAPVNLAQWFNSLYYNPSLLNTSSSWTTGSAYLQYTSTEVADTYTVVDFTGPVTSGNTPNPVASGTTIAALMTGGGIFSSLDDTTYTLSNGSVSSINGVTTYVAAAVRPNLTTPTFRAFYELNGNVYEGDLIKAGTVFGGTAFPVAAPGTANGYTVNYSNQYQIRLNAAAVASLHAAVTF